MAEIQKKQTDGLVPTTGLDTTFDAGSQNIVTTGTITAGNFVGPGGGGAGAWGGITGTLSDQTDLQAALDAKVSFTDELAQDAVGAMVTDGTLVYTDATPILKRGVISGDITIADGSNTAAITAGVIVNADINASAAISLSKLSTGSLPSGITVASANIDNFTIVNTDISNSAAIDATKIHDGSISNTEFGYLNGVTSAIQTQLDAKQATLTGLTASVTELNYTDGVTSAIQTQLDGKVNDTGDETIAGVKTFSSIPLLPGTDPTTANQAARKSYVDAIGQMVDPSLYKNACTCATTANITLSGEQTIDTFATSATRVLVWKQTAPAENGIYISNSGAWTRASDYNTAAEVIQGTSTFVLDGSLNKNRLFVMNEATVSTLGTDPIGFTPLSGLGEYNAGIGLDLSGNTFSIVPDFVEDVIDAAVTGGVGSAYGVELTYNAGDLYANLDYSSLTGTVDPITTSTTMLAILNVGEEVTKISVDDFISESGIINYTGTVAEDSIASFNNTSGQIKDSGIQITGTTTKTIQPATLGTNLIITSPEKAVPGTGATVTIKGGDAWADLDDGGNDSGGDLILSGGTGYFGFETGATFTLDGGRASGTGAEKARLVTGSGGFQIQRKTSSFVTTITPSTFHDVGLSATITGAIVTDNNVSLSNTTPVVLTYSTGNTFVLNATGDRTISAPTGVFSIGIPLKIWIQHYASGADRTLTLTTGTSGSFRFTGNVTGLTTTTSGTTDYIGCMYNTTDARWDVISYVKGASASPTPVGPQTQDIQIFTSSGTWTKPSGSPKTTQIIAIGGGGGGGSGRKGAAATVRAGGAGGGGGGFGIQTFLTSILSSTVAVTVGTGGAGGASRTTDSTSGAAGTAGGVTSFGEFFRVGRGNAGAGGTTTAATGGSSGIWFPSNAVGISGASSSGSGAAGSTPTTSNYPPGSGASGGGITTGNVANIGGVGGQVGFTAASGASGYNTVLAGGTFGATSTAGGNGNASPTNSGIGGSGGGGGGASISTNAGAGGNGALYGGGGGGGGGATNSVGNSGAGGTGGNGILIAITTY